jgi:hypothetical protein
VPTKDILCLHKPYYACDAEFVTFLSCQFGRLMGSTKSFSRDPATFEMQVPLPFDRRFKAPVNSTQSLEVHLLQVAEVYALGYDIN